MNYKIVNSVNFGVLKKYQTLIIFIILLAFMIFSLWFRGLSASSINLPNYTGYSSPDIWYNFRLAELTIHHFPVYPWFDPMTAFPYGKEIDWGPLLAFIGGGIAILSGMTSRTDMMNLVSWVGPVFAALLVPVLYFIGKVLWNWKTGILAAGLITILSPLYFVNTSFAYFDHHGLETFFSTLFCLLYIVSILTVKKRIDELKITNKLIIVSCLSVATGVVYFLGYANIPTMILFGLIVAGYTFLQFIVDTVRSKPTEYLLFTNLGVFIPVVLLMALFGVKQEGMSLQHYTIGQVIAILALIAATVLFYLLSKYLGSRKKIFLPSLVIIIAAGISANFLMFNNMFIGMLLDFFGQGVGSSTIIESQPWTLALAFDSFGIFLILAMIGFAVLVYRFYQDKREGALFFLIWSFVAIFATIQHLRYEYYLVVNLALLSSLCIIEGLDTGKRWVSENSHDADKSKNTKDEVTVAGKKSLKLRKSAVPKNKDRKHGSKGSSPIPRGNAGMGWSLIFIVVLLTIVGTATSIQKDFLYSTSPDRLINENWVDTLEWLPLHTPDPGIDYLKIYDKNNFTYPKQSYGILAWWDYGHYITYISKRIPNTNPFQDNLVGPTGVAAFFLSDSENNATKILDSLGSRYIITDTSLTTIKFGGVTEWIDNNTENSPYFTLFYLKNPTPSGPWIQIKGELAPYYKTTIVRLQNYDGSMIAPGKTVYTEYHFENQNGIVYPIATKFQLLEKNATENAINSFNTGHGDDLNALEVGQYLYPLDDIPALRHFRLVYESPGNSSSITFTDVSGIPAVNYVKVFEYVSGAHIKGNGLIEVQVVTNTGRSFQYQQQSINGEFIVPYSTVNNTYDVKTNGGYHIVGTNKTINVDEESVLKGTDVA